MRRLYALLVPAMVLGLAATGGTAAGSTHRATAAAPTVVRHVSPLDDQGELRPAYTVKHVYGSARCQRGSAMTGTAYRCFTSRSPDGVYDPCWVGANDERVFCLLLPWQHKVIQLKVTNGYDDADPFGHQPRPWGVRLASGQRCLLDPAAVESTHGRPIHYYCSKHVALAGRFDRSSAAWRVHAYRNTTPHATTATYVSLGRVPVAVAWRGKASRTDLGG